MYIVCYIYLYIAKIRKTGKIQVAKKMYKYFVYIHLKTHKCDIYTYTIIHTHT